MSLNCLWQKYSIKERLGRGLRLGLLLNFWAMRRAVLENTYEYGLRFIYCCIFYIWLYVLNMIVYFTFICRLNICFMFLYGLCFI